jgi:hypothetical protein
MPLPRDWVTKIFSKFASFYGEDFARKWANVDHEAMIDDWALKLERFNGTTIGKALDWCAENQSKPPTLPEFIQMCKSSRVEDAVHYLPHHFVKTEEADRNFKLMHDILKGRVKV